MDSDPIVPTGGLRKLLALLTMVATVLQYNALANASLVALHWKKRDDKKWLLHELANNYKGRVML